MTRAELDAANKAAEKAGLDLSEWVRQVIARAVRRALGPSVTAFSLFLASCSSTVSDSGADAGVAPACSWSYYGHACDLDPDAGTFGTCCEPYRCVANGKVESIDGAPGSLGGDVARCN